MRTRLDACVSKLNEQIAEYNLCNKEHEEFAKGVEAATSKLKDLDACLVIIQNIAKGLQNNVKEKLVAVVQRALDATFPTLSFDMEFVTRRDKTECDLLCTDADGNRQDVLNGVGGGVKDIISFALRVAVWSLDKGASSVIMLDEPMKFLSEGMRIDGANLLKVLSDDLHIQFLIVSHVDEIKNIGTTTYLIQKNKDGRSFIKNY